MQETAKQMETMQGHGNVSSQ